MIRERIPTASPIDSWPISFMIELSWERPPMSQGYLSFKTLYREGWTKTGALHEQNCFSLLITLFFNDRYLGGGFCISWWPPQPYHMSAAAPVQMTGRKCFASRKFQGSSISLSPYCFIVAIILSSFSLGRENIADVFP